MAPETVRFVGQAVAVVIADTKNRRAMRRKPSWSTYEELPAVADVHAAIKAAHRTCTPKRRATWSSTGLSATRAQPRGPSPRRPTRDARRHQQPPGPERDGAARGDRHYDKAEDHFTLYTTSQNPHVARLVMWAFYNVAPEHKLRVIAPDVGGGFGSKIYIYPEEIVACGPPRGSAVP